MDISDFEDHDFGRQMKEHEQEQVNIAKRLRRFDLAKTPFGPLAIQAATRIEQLEAALRLWLQYDESYEDFVHMITDYEEALEATRAALGEKKDGN